jgi:molecular chaperone DnaK
MIREAEANAETDKKQKELIEARNNAEAQVHAAKTDLKEVENNLTAEEKSKIDEAIKAVETAIAGSDKDDITQKTSDLFAAIVPIAQAKSKQEQMHTSDSDTVDAEFTEKS